MSEVHKTLLCYYCGVDGSTIRIDVKTRKWLEYFHENILSLVDGDAWELQIGCLNDVDVVDFKSFALVKVQHAKHRKIITNGQNFAWYQDAEELITLLGLIEGLLDGDSPGHQYLTNKDDGALIMLAYRE